MDNFSRRNVLVAGGLMAASTIAEAQSSDQKPQPSRSPGVGGTDPGPRNLSRDRENPNLLNPPSTDSGTRSR